MINDCQYCMHLHVCKYKDKIEIPKCEVPLKATCAYFQRNCEILVSKIDDNNHNIKLYTEQVNALPSCNEPCEKKDCYYNVDKKCKAEFTIQQNCIYGEK